MSREATRHLLGSEDREVRRVVDDAPGVRSSLPGDTSESVDAFSSRSDVGETAGARPWRKSCGCLVGLVLPGDAEAGDGVPGPGETLASKDSGHLVRACGWPARVCSRSSQPSRNRRRSSGRCFQSKRQHIPANGDAVR